MWGPNTFLNNGLAAENTFCVFVKPCTNNFRSSSILLRCGGFEHCFTTFVFNLQLYFGRCQTAVWGEDTH